MSGGSRCDGLLTLDEAVRAIGRAQLASALGCTAPALANALNAKRVIMIRVFSGKVLNALEISPFPSKGFSVKRCRGTSGLQVDISSIFAKGSEIHERIALQVNQNHTPPVLLSG